MAQRSFILPTFLVLCTAACSDGTHDGAPDASDAAAGIDSRDVGQPDVGDRAEGGTDARDGAQPDVEDAGEVGIDSRDGSNDDGGDGGRNDGDGGRNDGDGAQNDGDGAVPPDGDTTDGPIRDGLVPDDARNLCAWTHEAVSFTVTLPDGSTDDCAHVPRDAGPVALIHRVLTGVVRASSTDAGKSTVTIDSCAGDGCAPQSALIDVSTPVSYSVPVGAFVEAEYWVRQSFACTHFLRISNLAEWNGQKNPISDASKTYLVASDGLSNPSTELAPTGITMATIALGCVAADAGPGCTTMPMTIDSYSFRFTASGTNPITLPMGEVTSWPVNGQELVVKNLRSYESGFCDDYWNWSFVMVGH